LAAALRLAIELPSPVCFVPRSIEMFRGLVDSAMWQNAMPARHRQRINLDHKSHFLPLGGCDDFH
jgi:hypothetical protein